MEWTADVAAGDWLRARIDDPWGGTMHDTVLRGFAAYARVLHPASRERPVGRAWPVEGDAAAWEAFTADRPEIDGEAVTWATTAAAFGTVMHPLAQWQRLVRSGDPYGDGIAPRDADGWRYDAPADGDLEPETLAVLAGILARHTTTPDDGCLALWEGWGGIVGGTGYGPSRYALDAGPDADPRHEAFLAHSVRDVFNEVFRRPTWQPGILSDEISRGPRFALPQREYVLFRGGVSELADPAWGRNAPWRDPERGLHGFDRFVHSPNLVWPADRAWVMATDIDLNATIVAGTAELVDAIAADSRLEAARIPAGAVIGWTSDEVNA
ncbi:hypothetical protein GH740_03445 [Microbacterium sp. SYP-A9085]|uniref:hypothetical protein n=1 Tax=Microbacterium sp. SYP-A9085 TaxID=2664454 RepID=UPI00129B6362|nr:hypothetical protein [Microbacterium sp. SYP-A9085]MRH28366.1 hypothetical protein [Microbacterium sp. SYP-A9085]